MTPETRQPCMRKYVTCDADESADNWCEACRPRLTETRQPTRREALIALLQQRAIFLRSLAWWSGGDRLIHSASADAIAKLLNDAADLLREEGEAQRSPCVHCGGPNAIVCNRCHSAVAYAPVRPRVDVREEGEARDLIAKWRQEVKDRAGQGCGCYGRSTQLRICADELEAMLGEARVDPVPPPPHQDEQKG